MGAFSIWHWTIVLIVAVIPIVGWCTIVRKAGFSPWWGLLSVVPLVNIVMLFVFAYTPWPGEKRAAETL